MKIIKKKRKMHPNSLKNLKYGGNPENRFGNRQQPTTEAKLRGKAEAYAQELARKEMWHFFVVAVDGTGKEVNVPEETVKRWQKLLLAPTKYDEKGNRISGYTDKEKDTLMLNIMDQLLPKEQRISGKDGGAITFDVLNLTEQEIGANTLDKELEEAETLIKKTTKK